MEDTTSPWQRQKRSRGGDSEDEEAGDTDAARGSSRLAAAIDVVVAEEKLETLFIQEEEDEEELMDMYQEPDRTPRALREINFFYVCCAPDDGSAGAGAATMTADSRAADQEPVDVALTLGCKGPYVAGPEADTVDATLRLGLGPPPSAAMDDVAVAAQLGEAEDDDDDDLRLHLRGGVPFSAASPAPKLDTRFWYPLPFADDPCHAPPPSPATPEEDYYSAASPEEGRGAVVVVPDDAFNSFVVPTMGNDDGFVEFVMDDDDAATGRPSGSGVLDLNQPCSSSESFPDDIAEDVVVVDERPGRETAPEQRRQSATPYTFI